VEGLDIGTEVYGKLRETTRDPIRKVYLSAQRPTQERLGRDGSGCSIYRIKVRTT
jgi:hypothetical protein